MIVEHTKSKTDGQKYPFLGYSERGYMGCHYFLKAKKGEYWYAIDDLGVRVDDVNETGNGFEILVFKVGDALTLVQE